MIRYKDNLKFKLLNNKTLNVSSLGPILGQRGIKINDFKDNFVKLNKQFVDNIPINVKMLISQEKKFKLFLRNPDSSYFLKTIIVSGGSPLAGISNISSISLKQIYELSKFLNADAVSIKSRCKILIGTAKSFGLNLTKN